jgi:hypothetical protein
MKERGNRVLLFRICPSLSIYPRFFGRTARRDNEKGRSETGGGVLSPDYVFDVNSVSLLTTLAHAVTVLNIHMCFFPFFFFA